MNQKRAGGGLVMASWIRLNRRQPKYSWFTTLALILSQFNSWTSTFLPPPPLLACNICSLISCYFNSSPLVCRMLAKSPALPFLTATETAALSFFASVRYSPFNELLWLSAVYILHSFSAAFPVVQIIQDISISEFKLNRTRYRFPSSNWTVKKLVQY